MNIFDLIGRYYGSRFNWFRPMRRLAKGNPVDFGKSFVFCYAMFFIGKAMQKAIEKYVGNVTAVTDSNSIFADIETKTANFAQEVSSSMRASLYDQDRDHSHLM